MDEPLQFECFRTYRLCPPCVTTALGGGCPPETRTFDQAHCLRSFLIDGQRYYLMIGVPREARVSSYPRKENFIISHGAYTSRTARPVT